MAVKRAGIASRETKIANDDKIVFSKEMTIYPY